MELLTLQTRRGAVIASLAVVSGQTAVEISVIPNPVDLALRGQVGLAITVEQTPDNGARWFTLGGCSTPDVAAALSAVKPGQLPRTAVTLSLTEQIYRADKADELGFATARDLTFNGELYRQLALCPELRVTVDTGEAELSYSVDAVIDARSRQDLPLGMQ